MRTQWIVGALAVSLVATVGCSGSNGGGDKASTADSVEGSSLQQDVVGSWTDKSYTSDGGPFAQITINADNSYTWTAPCVSSGAADCNSIQTSQGTWAIQTSGPQLGDPGGASQLVLTDSFNQETAYFVSATSSKLVLKAVFGPGTSGFTFTPEASQPSSLQTEVVGSWTDKSYATDAANGAPFAQITINADNSFTWTAPCESNGAANCNSISTDQGTWAIQTSGPQLGAPGGATQLALTDQFNQKSAYFVSVTSGTLSLSAVFGPGDTGFAFTSGQ